MLAVGWAATGDRRAVFAECYQVMTHRVTDALAGDVFHDGPWVQRLLDRFADYYFDAIDGYAGAVPDQTCPQIWREALDACADPLCHPVQALMLGINAHINHDLALALVDVLDDWPALDEETRLRRHQDHERVNEIIHDTTDEVQRDVVAAWSPLAGGIDFALGRLDEWAFAQLAATWRTRVWSDAMGLVALAPQERSAAAVRIGERATGIATIIRLGRR